MVYYIKYTYILRCKHTAMCLFWVIWRRFNSISAKKRQEIDGVQHTPWLPPSGDFVKQEATEFEREKEKELV